MAAPQNVLAFDLETAIAAAERWSNRQEHHSKFERAARKKQYSELDTPERCAARANRLLGKLRHDAPRLAEAMATEFEESTARNIARTDVTAETVSDDLLERVIGSTRDFQFVEFLDRAIHVSKSVGRVVMKLGSGRSAYGTGFMVSPRLMITNHHVLTSADDAARSTIEFDYQRDRFGRSVPVRVSKLDPASLFLADKELDFALVAVSPDRSGRPLRDYGWCPLIKELGKIVAGEPINIIQHPKGEMKQVVIRENRLIDALEGADLFLHYEADTEPGSSGSPVFNDQWEVIALHHSGVPKRNNRGDLLGKDGKVWRDGDDPTRLEWVANEGVRVSKLVEFIAKAPVKAAGKPFLRELLEAKGPVDLPDDGPKSERSRPEPDEEEPSLSDDRPARRANSITLAVPLHITISVGTPGRATAGSTVSLVDAPDGLVEDRFEKIVPDPNDPDYEDRPGYDPDFLGFKVPFPRLTSATRQNAFALPGLNGDDRFLLRYHHYSIIFNKSRKLAFAAGVNYDPTAKIQYPRDKDGDRWFYDPRISPKGEFQAGEDLYASNPLDRGHLVRRADAAWGHTKNDAKLANDDTFHFTNCSPQHAITNQGQVTQAPPGLKLWGKLENHVANQGRKDKRKLCVFNGPVFRSSDKPYRGVKIPREFWKAVVFENDDGEPSAAAFILTQADLIQDIQEEFEVGEYQAVQVRINDLEARTGLDFGSAAGWDVLEREGVEERFTGDGPAIVLGSVTDVVL